MLGEESGFAGDPSPITEELEDVQPSISEVALGYVSKRLLVRVSDMYFSELDAESKSSQDGPCQSEILITRFDGGWGVGLTWEFERPAFLGGPHSRGDEP